MTSRHPRTHEPPIFTHSVTIFHRLFIQTHAVKFMNRFAQIVHVRDDIFKYWLITKNNVYLHTTLDTDRSTQEAEETGVAIIIDEGMVLGP